MRGGPIVEWKESAGSPVPVGDATITPLSRSLVLRWPGGGVAWSGPAAVLVEREGETDRVPVANVNRRIRWGLREGAVVLIATWIAHNRRRKDSNG